MSALKIITSFTALSFLTSCSSLSRMENLENRVAKLEQAETKQHSDPKIEELLSKLVATSYHSAYEPSKNDILITLGLLKEKSSVPQIISIAQVSSNQNFRQQANKVLGWIKDERSIPYLKKAMKNDTYIHARRQAAHALEKITGDKYLTEENGFQDPVKAAKERLRVIREKIQKQQEANKK